MNSLTKLILIFVSTTSNIRGLQTNYKNLELFIQNFSHKPDIIVWTETGILPCHNLDNLNDYNYETYYKHSNINKTDGVH